MSKKYPSTFERYIIIGIIGIIIALILTVFLGPLGFPVSAGVICATIWQSDFLKPKK